jgi:hypothetical protein
VTGLLCLRIELCKVEGEPKDYQFC